MDETGSELTDEACAASGPEPGESICEDPVITRMPGPVQEVFYHLDLKTAMFTRVDGNVQSVDLPQSCTPSRFTLSRDCIHSGTTLWVRGKSGRSGLVSSKEDIMFILSFFRELDRAEFKEVYWTRDGFLCSSFAAECAKSSQCTGIVTFAVLYQLEEVDGGNQLKFRHISIDAREFVFPTTLSIPKHVHRFHPDASTHFIGHFMSSIRCVLGLTKKS